MEDQIPNNNSNLIKIKLREALLLELKQSKYSYGCIMLYFKVYKSWWDKIQNLINDDDVAKVNGVNGREKYNDAHVTILYGFHKNIDEEELKNVVLELPVRDIEAKNISIFDGDEFDVIKFDISGSFLHTANRKLKDFNHTNTFNKYTPHMTICYVKKGEGEKYVQKLNNSLSKMLKPSHFVYSKANGTKEIIKFNK